LVLQTKTWFEFYLQFEFQLGLRQQFQFQFDCEWLSVATDF